MIHKFCCISYATQSFWIILRANPSLKQGIFIWRLEMLESVVHNSQIFIFHLLCRMNWLHYFFCAGCNIVWLQKFVRFRIRPFSLVTSNFGFDFAHFNLSKKISWRHHESSLSPIFKIVTYTGFRVSVRSLPKTAMEFQSIWLPIFTITNECPIKIT